MVRKKQEKKKKIPELYTSHFDYLLSYQTNRNIGEYAI